MTTKQTAPRNAPRITVELETFDFREQAQRAVRRMGYMNLSDYIREKLSDAIKQVAATPRQS